MLGKMLRWFLAAVCVGFLLAIIFGVGSEFFIELAREKGWYDTPSKKLDETMTSFSLFVSQTWFLVSAALSLGLAVGAWIDWLLRKIEKKQKSGDMNDEELIALSADIEEIKCSLAQTAEAPPNEALFHDATALMLRLSRLGFMTPYGTKYGCLTELGRFSVTAYSYFSAISPFIRIGELEYARDNALDVLNAMMNNLENLPSNSDAVLLPRPSQGTE